MMQVTDHRGLTVKTTHAIIVLAGCIRNRRCAAHGADDRAVDLDPRQASGRLLPHGRLLGHL